MARLDLDCASLRRRFPRLVIGRVTGYGRYGRRYGREPYYHGPFYGYGRLQGIPSGGYGYRRGSIGGGEHRLGTVSRETTMDRDYQRDRGMYGGYVYNRNYGRYGDYSLEGRW